MTTRRFEHSTSLTRAIPLVFLGLIGAGKPAVAGTPTSCASLQNFSFPNTTITGVQTNSGGPYVAPDTWHLAFANLPPSCQVSATIKPTADSSINVQVWMPTQGYNGRYLGTGNGGYAGGFFQSELAAGINNGFATANTDMGTSPYSDGISADGLVGHPEKWKDFGWRSTHLMTLFSKALIQAFYGNAANHSYFAGCSTGGQQSLMEAQRFPTDYDGILAGAPAFNRTHIHTVTISQYKATHARLPASYIPPTKLDVVNIDPPGTWFYMNDKSPKGEMEPATNGDFQTALANGMIHTHGKMYTDWGGGIGLNFVGDQMLKPVDASSFKGIRFKASGSGSMHVGLATVVTMPEFGVCTKCYDHYAVDINGLTSEPKVYEYTWEKLHQSGWGSPKAKLDPKTIIGLNLTSKGATPWDFSIGDLEWIK